MKKTEKSSKDNEVSFPSMSSFVALIILVIAFQFATGFGIYYLIDNWSDRASFGDMFGATGALFSGLAFSGVIYTILLQRRELELQRKELELTREELKRTAEAQEKSQLALAEQAEALAVTAKLSSLSLIPSLYCSIQNLKTTVGMIINNVGGVSAFDIDVIIVGAYFEEDLDILSFISKYVTKEDKKKIDLKPTNEGSYGVFDRLVYPVFPQKRSVFSLLGLPIKPGSLYVLLQYRDIQGSNYHQQFWFFDNNFNSSKSDYRLGSLDPAVPVSYPRIDYGDEKPMILRIKNRKLPRYISNGIGKLFSSSISSGLVKNAKLDVEDRGKWSDL